MSKDGKADSILAATEDLQAERQALLAERLELNFVKSTLYYLKGIHDALKGLEGIAALKAKTEVRPPPPKEAKAKAKQPKPKPKKKAALKRSKPLTKSKQTTSEVPEGPKSRRQAPKETRSHVATLIRTMEFGKEYARKDLIGDMDNNLWSRVINQMLGDGTVTKEGQRVTTRYKLTKKGLGLQEKI